MSLPAEKFDSPFSYRDYLNWSDETRYELIDGVAYAMSPAPSRIHQGICVNLVTIFNNYLKGNPCRVYVAPFDVRLGGEADDECATVVQPDIVVVCDKNKLDDRGCKGSPDLVIEILSPSSAYMDYVKKLGLYERHKVKEYWIVHPYEKMIVVYRLNDNGVYGHSEIFVGDIKAKTSLWPDFDIDLNDVFRSLE